MLFVNHHKHNLQTSKKPRKHANQIQTIQTKHDNITEHHINNIILKHLQNLQTATNHTNNTNTIILTKQINQLNQDKFLIINNKHLQNNNLSHAQNLQHQ